MVDVKKEMTFQVVDMTPEKAKLLLELNKANFRSINKPKVTQLAGMMLRGQWELNGETVKVGSSGVLIDGQHRLAAVVESGVTVPMAICHGVDGDGRSVDRGQRRTISQYLKSKNFKHCKTVAAIARHLAFYRKGMWGDRTWPSYRVGDDEVMDICLSEQGRLEEICVIAKRAGNLCPHSIIGTIIYVASEQLTFPSEASLVNYFVRGVAKGEGDMCDEDPVFVLRERLLHNKIGSSRMEAPMMRWIVTKAWNLHATGQPATRNAYHLRSVGPSRGAMPSRIYRIDDDGNCIDE